MATNKLNFVDRQILRKRNIVILIKFIVVFF